MDKTKSEMTCLDALTCINAFMYHYKAHENKDDLLKRMSSVYALCENYGLIPKGNVFNS